MKEDNFDKIIGRKLGEFREEPAPGLFGRIEESLVATGAVPAAPRRRSLLYRITAIGAAAVVMFGLMIGGYTLLHKKENGGPLQTPGNVITETADKAPGTASASDGDATTNNEGSVKKARRTTDDGITVAEKLRKAIEEDPRAAQIVKVVAGHLDTTEGGEAEIGSEIAAIEPIELLSAAQVEPQEDTRITQVKDNNALYTPEYWNEIFAEERKPARSNRRLAASVYGGNSGATNGNYKTNDPSALVASKMTVENKTGMDFNHDGEGIYFTPEAIYPYETRAEREENYELVHKMPFNFGLNLAYPLSEHTSIVTGLNYSQLVSTATQNRYSIRQEVHYIGIPVGVNYTFYSRQKFNLYLYGGGMIEKAVSARKLTQLTSDGGTNRETDKLSTQGVQMSVRAAAGISLALARNIYIYLEPGVVYYFEKAAPFETYRTEYPTSFSLTAGIRFGL